MLMPLAQHIMACPHVVALNVCTRKVGGIRFIKVGRLTLSFCVSRSYRSIKGAA